MPRRAPGTRPPRWRRIGPSESAPSGATRGGGGRQDSARAQVLTDRTGAQPDRTDGALRGRLGLLPRRPWAGVVRVIQPGRPDLRGRRPERQPVPAGAGPPCSPASRTGFGAADPSLQGWRPVQGPPRRRPCLQCLHHGEGLPVRRAAHRVRNADTPVVSGPPHPLRAAGWDRAEARPVMPHGTKAAPNPGPEPRRDRRRSHPGGPAPGSGFGHREGLGERASERGAPEDAPLRRALHRGQSARGTRASFPRGEGGTE